MTPSEREATTTSAPASRRATTSAAPMPRLPPVTTARLPSSRNASRTPLTAAPPECLKPRGWSLVYRWPGSSRMDHDFDAAGIVATDLQGVLRRIELVVARDYRLQVNAPIGGERDRGRVCVRVAERARDPDLLRLD